MWGETFTKSFLSNIINHGESDVQSQISISGSHLSVLGFTLWKEKNVFEGYFNISLLCSGHMFTYSMEGNVYQYVRSDTDDDIGIYIGAQATAQ